MQGRYTVMVVIGQGGMGAVYLAEDRRLFGKRWALKEMLDTVPDPAARAKALQLFQQEVKLLATLSHPNLPHISDYFAENSRQYLVMEYVDGTTLDDLLRQSSGLLPETQVVGWAIQVCDALDYLHSRQPQPIIFRDLKPANIMIEKEGRIKLIDFGIARLFRPGKAKDTQVMGTPGYAAPEQYGFGQTDARSDIYALGATLHHLLTGRDPAVQAFVFPPCRSINPRVSPDVEAVIAQATNPNPDKRFTSMSEMKQQLLATLSPTARSAMGTAGGPSSSGATAQSGGSLPVNRAPVPVQHIQTAPVAMFLAYCSADARETAWIQESDGSCTCVECDQSWETGDIESVLEATCNRCSGLTTWTISEELCTCLGCGESFEASDIEGMIEAYCSQCQAKSSWIVHSSGRTCLWCGQQR